MELAVITLANTLENQERSRQIRDFHKKKGQPLAIRFSEELTHIVLEAPCLYLPDRQVLGADAVVEGSVRKCTGHYEIHPRNKGKTINLHLDSELAAELEQIRARVSSKTQHDVILEMFVRGMRAYLAEQNGDRGENG
jgi:urease accessory protein UreE